MLTAFSAALKTALTSFITDMTTAVSDNAGVVIPFTLGIVGVFLLWRVIKKLVASR